MSGRLAATLKNVNAIKFAVFPTDSTQIRPFCAQITEQKISQRNSQNCYATHQLSTDR